MIQLKSAGQRQRSISIHGSIANRFCLHRNRASTAEHRKLRNAAMNTWCEIPYRLRHKSAPSRPSCARPKRFVPQDKAALAAKILNQVWEAA